MDNQQDDLCCSVVVYDVSVPSKQSSDCSTIKQQPRSIKDGTSAVMHCKNQSLSIPCRKPIAHKPNTSNKLAVSILPNSVPVLKIAMDSSGPIHVVHQVRTGTPPPRGIDDSTAASLRRNDKQTDGTTLDLDSASDLGDLEDFLEAVHTNQTIEVLQLEGEMICSLNPEDGLRLFNALGGLPCLTKLHLHNYVAPLHLLTALVERARNLEQMTLHTAQLLGRNENESVAFIRAIQTLQHLEAFKCKNAIVAGQGLSLETLVRALSQIEKIQKVELEMERGGELTCPTLQALCECPQMRDLRLWRITLHPQHLILIASIVQHNQTIQILELGEMGYADHTLTSYVAVADMLRTNSCLEHFGLINFSGLDDDGCTLMANALEDNATLLVLSVRGCDNHVMSQPATEAVAQMFSHNQTLQEFSMNTVGVDDDGAVTISQAVGHHNTTLQSLMLQRIVGNKSRGYLALKNMLETNYILTRVYPEPEGDVKAKMDFWISLNRLGLRQVQLYVDTNRAQFLEMLERSRFDLDIIFYLLSTNPDFLDL